MGTDQSWLFTFYRSVQYLYRGNFSCTFYSQFIIVLTEEDRCKMIFVVFTITNAWDLLEK